MNLEEDVLAEIRPSEQELARIKGAAKALAEKVQGELDRLGIDAKPVLVGSVAKGTHLKAPDLDLFIPFPSSTSREELERMGLELGHAAIPDAEERYAEHPYIHGFFEGLECDVVPCYKVEDAGMKMSAVDRTPFHTRYVLDNLDEGLRDDVRLLKQFLKGIGVYGAEAEIRGFSGYLCELLVMHAGGFRMLLEAAKGWKHATRLSLGNDTGVKYHEEFVFVDPVDSNRNVASAVSHHNLSLFMLAAREYLARPRREFFFPNPVRALSADELASAMGRRGTDFLAFDTGRPPGVEDVVFPQVWKCEKGLRSLLENEGFDVLHTAVSVGARLRVIIELASAQLPRVVKHSGPPVWHRNSESFLEKWRGNERTLAGPHVEGKRWVVDISREFWDATELLKARVPETNLGKGVNDEIIKGWRVIPQAELPTVCDAVVLTKMLDKRHPWEW